MPNTFTADDASERERRLKRLPAEACGAERPDGSPQPADPAHRQPAHITGENPYTPQDQPGRNPNRIPGKPGS